jgi:ABC-type amino acid transport system permease subunit
VFAAGAVGELFPIPIIAVYLGQRGSFVALASVALVGALALVLTVVPWLARSAAVQRMVTEGQEATGQVTLRWSFVLLIVVRGLPSLLAYRRAMAPVQRVEMTFITATSLPLLIALAAVGEQDGVMLPATAASLIGAGVLSVLVFPLIAVGLHRRAALTPADVGITAEETPQA